MRRRQPKAELVRELKNAAVNRGRERGELAVENAVLRQERDGAAEAMCEALECIGASPAPNVQAAVRALRLALPKVEHRHEEGFQDPDCFGCEVEDHRRRLVVITGGSACSSRA
jgi:hypothetical protein